MIFLENVSTTIRWIVMRFRINMLRSGRLLMTIIRLKFVTWIYDRQNVYATFLAYMNMETRLNTVVITSMLAAKYFTAE